MDEVAKEAFRQKGLEILISYKSLEEYYGVQLTDWEKEVEASITQKDINKEYQRLREVFLGKGV